MSAKQRSLHTDQQPAVPDRREVSSSDTLAVGIEDRAELHVDVRGSDTLAAAVDEVAALLDETERCLVLAQLAYRNDPDGQEWREHAKQVGKLANQARKVGRPPDPALHDRIRETAPQCLKRDGSVNLSETARRCDCARATVRKVLGL